MEGQAQNNESTGVEGAAVAGEQSQETISNESTSAETNTGVETTEVAAQVKDEKDFSAALKARETQLRQQMEKEYGERAKQADAYQQKLDKVAKFYGYDSHDEYMTALDQAEQDRLIQEQASKFGVPEDFIRQELSPLKNEVETLRQERERYQKQENERIFNAALAEVKQKYPDFESYQDKVFDMVVKGEAGSLESAYRLASYDDRIAATAKQTQQETLANLTKRGEKQVLASNDGTSDTQFSLASASLEDIRKISERVRNGERITL